MRSKWGLGPCKDRPPVSVATETPPSASTGHSSVAPTGHHAPLGKLVVLATGVVFGDIGTSPLYAIKECVDPDHGVAATQANVFGILSLVLWSLTMVVT